MAQLGFFPWVYFCSLGVSLLLYLLDACSSGVPEELTHTA
jgi:hypothetical protein